VRGRERDATRHDAAATARPRSSDLGERCDEGIAHRTCNLAVARTHRRIFMSRNVLSSKARALTRAAPDIVSVVTVNVRRTWATRDNSESTTKTARFSSTTEGSIVALEGAVRWHVDGRCCYARESARITLHQGDWATTLIVLQERQRRRDIYYLLKDWLIDRLNFYRRFRNMSSKNVRDKQKYQK